MSTVDHSRVRPNFLAGPGRVNSGSLGAGPLLWFLPRAETGGGGSKEDGFDGADGRPAATMCWRDSGRRRPKESDFSRLDDWGGEIVDVGICHFLQFSIQ